MCVCVCVHLYICIFSLLFPQLLLLLIYIPCLFSHQSNNVFQGVYVSDWSCVRLLFGNYASQPNVLLIF